MKYKWTVLFLVHASNKQTRDHVRALTDILKNTEYNSGIKVLILYGALQHAEAQGLRIQVTLHEILKDENSGRLNFSEVSGYGAIDIGDDKMLNKIFSEIRSTYSSDRFLLFTWDHGSGFGIFKTNPTERGIDAGGRGDLLNFEMDIMRTVNTGTALQKRNIGFNVITNYSEEKNTNSRDFGETRGAEKKKIETSMLTNDELRNILKYDADGKKVDLLIMMNCAMQMIETGYALHDVVEYLVAPETCIFWAGYDYKSIINTLCANPEIETETLGKYALDTIEAYYQGTPSKDYFCDLVVSLVKPGSAEIVKKAIDEMATFLTEKLDESFDDIKSIRSSCEDLTQKYVAGIPYHYVDFLNYITALKTTFNDINPDKLKEATKQYVIHIIKGVNYSNPGQVNGFTIYYPPLAKYADHDYYYDWFYKAGDQRTLFASASEWKEFLQDYLRHDRNKQKKNIS